MARKKTKGSGKKSKSNEEKGTFFVALNSPDSVRLSILETRRSVLESMKLFKEFKQIRLQKVDEKKLLRKQLKDISSAITKIKTSMPHMAVPPEVDLPKDAPKKIVLPPPQPVEEVKPRHKSELEKIEDELKDIESKLSSLS